MSTNCSFYVVQRLNNSATKTFERKRKKHQNQNKSEPNAGGAHTLEYQTETETETENVCTSFSTSNERPLKSRIVKEWKSGKCNDSRRAAMNGICPMRWQCRQISQLNQFTQIIERFSPSGENASFAIWTSSVAVNPNPLDAFYVMFFFFLLSMLLVSVGKTKSKTIKIRYFSIWILHYEFRMVLCACVRVSVCVCVCLGRGNGWPAIFIGLVYLFHAGIFVDRSGPFCCE